VAGEVVTVPGTPEVAEVATMVAAGKDPEGETWTTKFRSRRADARFPCDGLGLDTPISAPETAARKARNPGIESVIHNNVQR
jgi:hypothetical protein